VAVGGFSLKRLARVRELLERHVDSGFVPGAVAVLARHGEVHIEATGTLAFEGAGSGTPMAGDTMPPPVSRSSKTARRAVEPAAGVRRRRRRARLDRRRLPRLRLGAARGRFPPRRAGALAAVGDADDQRPPDPGAEGGLRVLARVLRHHGLGLRNVGPHPPHPPGAPRSAATDGPASTAPPGTTIPPRT
jgi:hypothetical protein